MEIARRLLGRHAEQEQMRVLLGHARNGRGGALFVTGEPGIGKTTLLDATTASLPGMRLLRVNGFEAEATIPFAGLQRLAIPLRPHFHKLPENHRNAMRIAAGAAEGAPPDRFLVGLGVLGLLAAAGDAEPVACVIDDAHLLDSESLDVLGLVARRLEAESVALVLAARDTSHLEAQLAGVPVLRLAGLEPEWALRLLTASLPDAIDPAAAAQVVAATGGNPLALVDLASELSARQLTESSLADEPLPIGHHLETLYLRRIRHLSGDLQLWLLLAAADSTGSIDLVRAAGHALGLPGDPVEEAESEGLVELGRTIAFRHPLVRSAAYNAVQGAQRRRAHRALALAAEELGLLELEAWHAAKATLGTDPDVADRLERVADTAGRRGGLASRARVLATSSTLTPPGQVKFTRLVAAAEAALASGAAQLAKSYLDDVDEDALDPISRGRLVSTRASIALFTADPALMEAGAQMLAAAECFHGHDVALEQDALIKAFEYTLPAERLAQGLTLSELGARLHKGAELRQGTAGTILRGLSAHILLPYEHAVPLMRSAVDTILALDASELLRYGATSVALTTALWDATARRECLTRTATAARDAGALQLLDSTLWIMSLAELTGGTPRHARQYIEQVRELRRAIGYDAEHVINVALLAWAEAPRPQVETIAEGAGAMGFGGVQSAGAAALAVRDLAEGDYEQAYRRLKPLIEDPFLQVTPLEVPDFVEAACRSGRAHEATSHVTHLEELASANGSPWTQGVAHRSRALIEEDAEPHHQAAIETLTPTDLDIELARAHLLHGEWLRRNRRRRDAREQLHTALRLFEQGQAPAFAQRARAELSAIGDRQPARGSRDNLDLTPQQLTVARLAANNHTNAEIAATMFLSPNTVDYHLRKVYQKLGISSRRQLAERLGADT
ncbi:helix-turn-helix transcriptional regulator [Nocardioides renjunii]|uniref:helix-turn-helix transcriptional regulator n=1 Tax=Nocardioides renjunii TaxID=3095075 RepID=UPI002AFDF3FF|nr:LuxR family transcriptional regulator [Nocardioides sp. S-34]WQQ20433.1 LuxR family transcriptional regulator [Nocardioides sp. S-34]